MILGPETGFEAEQYYLEKGRFNKTKELYTLKLECEENSCQSIDELESWKLKTKILIQKLKELRQLINNRSQKNALMSLESKMREKIYASVNNSGVNIYRNSKL